MKKFLAILLALSALQVAHAVNYYVSGTGSDTNNGLTTTTAFATIQKASDLTNPGDTVYIMNGTYTQVLARYGNWLTILNVTRSGTASAYITYTNYPGHAPVLNAVNCAWNCIAVFANYIKIEGLELIGRNASDSTAAGAARYDAAIAGTANWDDLGHWDINGLCINQDGNGVPYKHHIEIRNCKIHDFAAGGIAATNSDYVTLEGNTVYNNAWYTMWASSGISYITMANSDSNKGYKLITRGNKVYNNYTTVKWYTIKDYSDGNGIIVDVNTGYRGGHLIENNVVWDNGGRGLYFMSAKNGLFRNNISYWNSKASFSAEGEMVVHDAANVKYVNNIAWASTAFPTNYALNDDGSWGTNSGMVWKNNLTFSGTVGNPSVRLNKTSTTSIDSTNKLGVNPLLTSPGTSSTANFRPQTSSPAINAGTSAYGLPATDFDGTARVKGTAVDIGAYEVL